MSLILKEYFSKNFEEKVAFDKIDSKQSDLQKQIMRL